MSTRPKKESRKDRATRALVAQMDRLVNGPPTIDEILAQKFDDATASMKTYLTTQLFKPSPTMAVLKRRQMMGVSTLRPITVPITTRGDAA